VVRKERIVSKVSQRMESKITLPFAEGAAFDSHINDLDARRHPDTQDLLRKIKEWEHDPDGKCYSG